MSRNEDHSKRQAGARIITRRSFARTLAVANAFSPSPRRGSNAISKRERRREPRMRREAPALVISYVKLCPSIAPSPASLLTNYQRYRP